MKIRQLYFLSLYDVVKDPAVSYRRLSQYLDTIPFRYNLEMDRNRADDAIRLRGIFIEPLEADFSISDVDAFMEEPVSVFEVLVGICKRMDFNLDDLVSPPRNHIWYQELLRNLELDGLSDARFTNTARIREEVDEVVERLLDRTYDRNGVGSLFPLRARPVRDMKRVEIWYQMMQYLDENYA